MHVNEVRLSAGAGFVVVFTGAVTTMPGLSKTPAEYGIDVNDLADKNLNYLYIQFGTTDTASGEKVNGTINTYIPSFI